jgi:GNAT superfamily N-acetyltransferase
MDPILFPTRQSAITLQDITSINWARIIRLVVNKDQLTLVPPNVESLCEHQFHLPGSIVKAIYADSTPVGYIRLQQDKDTEQGHGQEQAMYWLQCFMIDQACQGLGFGTRALVALQGQLKAQSAEAAVAEETNDSNSTVSITLKVSTAPFASVHPEDSPEHFFAGVGFTKDDTGSEMVWVSC